MEKDKSQLDRFKEAARELGTDDDEERFNEKLKKLTRRAPKCERCGFSPKLVGDKWDYTVLQKQSHEKPTGIDTLKCPDFEKALTGV